MVKRMACLKSMRSVRERSFTFKRQRRSGRCCRSGSRGSRLHRCDSISSSGRLRSRWRRGCNGANDNAQWRRKGRAYRKNECKAGRSSCAANVAESEARNACVVGERPSRGRVCLEERRQRCCSGLHLQIARMRRRRREQIRGRRKRSFGRAQHVNVWRGRRMLLLPLRDRRWVWSNGCVVWR